MTAVLAHVLTLTTFGVHKPPAGLIPPPPNEWGEQVVNLTGACGTPIDGTAGYGELEVLLMSEALGECKLVWCMLCWPMGRPLA